MGKVTPPKGFTYRAKKPSPFFERHGELGGCELLRLAACPVGVGFLSRVKEEMDWGGSSVGSPRLNADALEKHRPSPAQRPAAQTVQSPRSEARPELSVSEEPTGQS